MTSDNIKRDDIKNINWDEQVEFLRGLAVIVRDEKLSELFIEQNGVSLNLRSRRPSLVPPGTSAPSAPVSAGAPDLGAAFAETEFAGAAEAEESESLGTAIVSPMVGVYYQAKTPGDPPFVQVGERVEIGQVVGLVEAMKTFNEIASEIEGEVVAIAAPNATLVETGAPLVWVR